MMTPYEIKLLLDIYSVADWFVGRTDPILNETLIEFSTEGLITFSGTLEGVKITPRGRAHVSQLCSLSLPKRVQQWSDSSGNIIPNI